MKSYLPIIRGGKPLLYVDQDRITHNQEPEGLTWEPVGGSAKENRVYLKYYGKSDPFQLKTPNTLLKTVVDRMCLNRRLIEEVAKTNCKFDFFDLFISHERDVYEYTNMMADFLSEVYNTIPKPVFYDFELELDELLRRINKRTILMKAFDEKIPRHVKYYQNRTITGRLTTDKKFPFLTMTKQKRNEGLPENENGLWLSVDYNGADIRTLFAILGREQPVGDIYQSIGVNAREYRDMSRATMKGRIFKILFSHKVKENQALTKHLGKKFYDKSTGILTTPFGRQIKCEERFIVPYLTQSSQSDNFLRRAIEVDKYFVNNNMKSQVKLLLHDEIFAEIDFGEWDKIPEVVRIMSNTSLGKFVTNVKVSKRLSGKGFSPFEHPKEFFVAWKNEGENNDQL